MRLLLMTIAILSIAACASDPKRPDGSGVRVSHDSPNGNCTEMEQVIGTSGTTSSGYDRALADMKRDAASRGGNYVKILAVSAQGSAIRGIAYRCN